MSKVSPIARLEIGYTLTNGDSGTTKVRFGTMVALEEKHGKTLAELWDGEGGTRLLAQILWLQLHPDADWNDTDSFKKFFMTIDELSFETPAGGQDEDPKLGQLSLATDETSSGVVLQEPSREL